MAKELSEQQRRLWTRMIHIVDEIDQGKLAFTRGVEQLEATLDAADIQDSQVVRGWYDLWTPLEEYRAQDANNVDMELVRPHLAALRRLLEAFLAETEGGKD